MFERFELMHAIGIVVSTALFYQSYLLVRNRKESIFEFLLWAGFGGALLVLSLADGTAGREELAVFDVIKHLLRLIGFDNGVNGIFTLTILGLLLLLFYTYANAKTNRKLLYDQTQEIALLRYELQQHEVQVETDEENRDP